jgi:hypothetical protein
MWLPSVIGVIRLRHRYFTRLASLARGSLNWRPPFPCQGVSERSINLSCSGFLDASTKDNKHSRVAVTEVPRVGDLALMGFQRRP